MGVRRKLVRRSRVRALGPRLRPMALKTMFRPASRCPAVLYRG